jgi:predicted nucleotidyltransferase
MLTTNQIKEIALPIANKYNVIRLELFGSYANNSATENSDADFLVEFRTPAPSIFKVMGFREELSNALGKPVDIVTLPLSNPNKLVIENIERIL